MFNSLQAYLERAGIVRTCARVVNTVTPRKINIQQVTRNTVCAKQKKKKKINNTSLAMIQTKQRGFNNKTKTKKKKITQGKRQYNRKTHDISQIEGIS